MVSSLGIWLSGGREHAGIDQQRQQRRQIEGLAHGQGRLRGLANGSWLGKRLDKGETGLTQRDPAGVVVAPVDKQVRAAYLEIDGFVNVVALIDPPDPIDRVWR